MTEHTHDGPMPSLPPGATLVGIDAKRYDRVPIDGIDGAPPAPAPPDTFLGQLGYPPVGQEKNARRIRPRVRLS